MPSLRINVRRLPDGGYEALFRVGDVAIGASSDEAVDALHAAAGLAHELSQAMAAHPELQALITGLRRPATARQAIIASLILGKPRALET